MSESTHTQLKKNVYQNYRQFIDTAKEIAFLESEMYQLSHMITDQRNLLYELTQFSVTGEKIDSTSVLSDVEDEVVKEKPPEDVKNSRKEFEEGRKRLFELLEKVEDCSQVMDVPTRYLLHNADLVEMDVAENTALHRVHGYLTNDGFMVATWLPNRRGPVRLVVNFSVAIPSYECSGVGEIFCKQQSLAQSFAYASKACKYASYGSGRKLFHQTEEEEEVLLHKLLWHFRLSMLWAIIGCQIRRSRAIIFLTYDMSFQSNMFCQIVDLFFLFFVAQSHSRKALNFPLCVGKWVGGVRNETLFIIACLELICPRPIAH